MDIRNNIRTLAPEGRMPDQVTGQARNHAQFSPCTLIDANTFAGIKRTTKQSSESPRSDIAQSRPSFQPTNANRAVRRFAEQAAVGNKRPIAQTSFYKEFCDASGMHPDAFEKLASGLDEKGLFFSSSTSVSSDKRS